MKSNQLERIALSALAFVILYGSAYDKIWASLSVFLVLLLTHLFLTFLKRFLAPGFHLLAALIVGLTLLETLRRIFLPLADIQLSFCIISIVILLQTSSKAVERLEAGLLFLVFVFLAAALQTQTRLAFSLFYPAYFFVMAVAFLGVQSILHLARRHR
ncbi:MAG: hypothetical protein COV74_08600 [Candidatus Omnitrophica bacterium CG11_big_fil_rev_8_21_14_0_20_45_26]|uniref:Uncharacterized protein n=1 Tax=Candidatus Abzuiibacterium crystallinum TaxID=1974748 RepID=A0A2H0LM80_9BACT|nr:MAG: hypothetical protein COV74_08600 [Candidatus Omnitrophica bacterium CG11_big_fil_rev_8_21_14_0_20_45_26]PIW63720.1 MAG: hypothetical protein COW12_09485 [Candidatus Omnitrophica bacterium CG12_big_fil_rev_8_21_14_0_65_45_16]